MANTFTATDQTVCGSVRVKFGTLCMDDGNAGSPADTGFERVIQVVGTSSGNARLTHTTGAIAACTAASGVSFQVVVFGV